MKAILIPLTCTLPEDDYFPLISFQSSGELLIRGRFISCDPFGMVHSVLNWLRQYVTHPAPVTTLILDLYEINAYSSRYLMDIFFILHGLKSSGSEIHITWYIPGEDQRMLEIATLISNCLELAIDIRESTVI